MASAERVDRVMHALADPTRRDIVRRTLQDEQSVTEIAARYPMSFAAVQKHVAVLERAGLVRKRRLGREQRVRGDPSGLEVAHLLLDDLERIWRARLDRFADVLTAQTSEWEDAPNQDETKGST